MKNLLISMLVLLVFSCKEDEIDLSALNLKITASAAGLNNVEYAKVYILNTETHERIWLMLSKRGDDERTWEGEATVPQGKYHLETVIKTTQNLSQPIAFVKELEVEMNNKASVHFENFQENGQYHVHDTDYHTVLISTSACNLQYKVYVGTNVCNSYVYVDRFFWGEDGDILAFSFDEVMIQNSSCTGAGDDIETVADKGIIERSMSAIAMQDCMNAFTSADVVDGTIMTGGKHNNGKEIEDEYHFMVFK
jgi:hypothetical protein